MGPVILTDPYRHVKATSHLSSHFQRPRSKAPYAGPLMLGDNLYTGPVKGKGGLLWVILQLGTHLKWIL